MGNAPRAVAKALTQQARHGDREQQIECEGSEAQPEGPVDAKEGQHGVGDGDRRKAVEQRRQDVKANEHHDEQGGVAVQPIDDEARPARGVPSVHVEHA